MSRTFFPARDLPPAKVEQGQHVGQAREIPAGSMSKPGEPAGDRKARLPVHRRLSRAVAPASAVFAVMLYPALVDPGADVQSEGTVPAAIALSAAPAADSDSDAATTASVGLGRDDGVSAFGNRPDEALLGQSQVEDVTSASDPPAFPGPSMETAPASDAPASPEPPIEIATAYDPPAPPALRQGASLPVSQADRSSGGTSAELAVEEAPGGGGLAEPATLPQPVYAPAAPETARTGAVDPVIAELGAAGAGTVEQPQYALSRTELAVGDGGPDASASMPDPERPEALRESDRKGWREVQRRLRLAGFDPGSPDGIPGARTREAILAWQQEAGVPADGILGAGELAILELETESAYREFLEAAAKRAAASAAEEPTSSGPVVHRSTRTGRYIDQRGCLREADGRVVPFYKSGCR